MSHVICIMLHFFGNNKCYIASQRHLKDLYCKMNLGNAFYFYLFLLSLSSGILQVEFRKCVCFLIVFCVLYRSVIGVPNCIKLHIFGI